MGAAREELRAESGAALPGGAGRKATTQRWRVQASRRAAASALGGGWFALAGCAQVEPAPPQPCAEPCTEASLVWVGDVLLADAGEAFFAERGHRAAFEFVGELLVGDAVIGNAEGPITTRTEAYDPQQTWSYNAQPEAADALAEAGFDAVSLANNHLMDRGPDGVADTLAELEGAGVVAFGAGFDGAQALAPFLVETPQGPWAVFGLGQPHHRVPNAGPGVGMLGTGRARDAVSVAAELGASPVAFVHWGANYSGVTDQQRSIAADLVDAGFELVLGHGPHVAQGVEFVDGVPVLWSLGNFTFATPGRFDEAFPGRGLVARTVVGEGVELELRCILTDNDEVSFQPRPCPVGEAEALFAELGIEAEGGVGRLGW